MVSSLQRQRRASQRCKRGLEEQQRCYPGAPPGSAAIQELRPAAMVLRTATATSERGRGGGVKGSREGNGESALVLPIGSSAQRYASGEVQRELAHGRHALDARRP